MTVLIEIIIGCAVFGVFAIWNTARDPLAVISDYPPAIRQRCRELGLIENTEKHYSTKDYVRKGIAMILFAGIFAFVLSKINGIHSFKEGFLVSYLIWLAIAWFDALVIDSLWFTHSPKVRIPGTEDMKEYGDCMFHIKQSAIGSLLGLPVCLLTGLIASVL